MSYPNPVAGNQSFSMVSNIAQQLPIVNTAELASDSTSTNTFAVENTTRVNNYPGRGNIYTVVGYVPTNFYAQTAAPGRGSFLNKAPGLPGSFDSTNPNLLTLPVNSIIVESIITNNDKTGIYYAPVLNVGQGTTPFSGAGLATATVVVAEARTPPEAPVSENTIFRNATVGDINSTLGVIASRWNLSPATGFNVAGLPVLSPDPPAATDLATVTAPSVPLVSPPTIVSGTQGQNVYVVCNATPTQGQVAVVIKYICYSAQCVP